MADTSTWSRYRATTRDYDAIVEHSRAVSASLAGHRAQTVHLGYAEQIFVKALVHAISMRSLAPDPARLRQNELWDLSSLAAIARCIIEAVDALLYISDARADESERDFRLQLWLLHDKTRRKKMLDAIGSIAPEAESIRAQASEMTMSLKHHAFYALLRAEVRKSIDDGNPPPFHQTQRERCIAAGLDYEYYNTATMQLSQYVHTLPLSVHHLFAFKAGDPDSLHLIKLPLDYALSYLAIGVVKIRELFPALTPSPPSRVRQKLTLWSHIAKHGVKGDG